MISNKIFTVLFTILAAISPSFLFCQELPTTKTFTPQDTVTIVEILPGVKKLEYRKIDSITEVQILSGNVKLKQGNSLFECDSCVITKRLNLFEAFGNVHINDADTTDVYSDHLRYLTDKKIAYLDKNVKLTDGKGVLTTKNLEYDVNTKVGIYRNGGKVVNKTSVLTSDEGYYYTDLKDVYFKKNVKLNDPKYTLETDSLLYNTESETARFIAETFIKDSSKRTIRTSDGFYNLRSGIAEFGNRPVVQDGTLQATGDKMYSDDSTGFTQIYGRAILVDTVEGRTVLADEIIFNNKTESFLATKRPLMIIRQEEDSIFISADTLFSAKLTDLYSIKDTATKKVIVTNSKNKDSTNRYFEAYRHVRIFTDSLQSICDSMFYSFKDSVFRLYDDPVVWSKGSQITGDTILLHTKNKKPHRMEAYKNSFIISLVKAEFYNQIKSVRLDAYFKNGNIDSVRAKGDAECIYFIQEEDSSFTGVNQSSSDLMDIFFDNKNLNRVVFRTKVKGTLWPIQQKTPQELRLSKFNWKEAKRPKNYFELFE